MNALRCLYNALLIVFPLRLQMSICQPAASRVMCGFPARLPEHLNRLVPTQDTCPTVSLHCSHTFCMHLAYTPSTFTTHPACTQCIYPLHGEHTSYLLSLFTHICHTCCMYLYLTPHTYHTRLTHSTPPKYTYHAYLTCMHHISLPYHTHPIHLGCQSPSHRSHNAAFEASGESPREVQ